MCEIADAQMCTSRYVDLMANSIQTYAKHVVMKFRMPDPVIRLANVQKCMNLCADSMDRPTIMNVLRNAWICQSYEKALATVGFAKMVLRPSVSKVAG